jgi:hypothetical protein
MKSNFYGFNSQATLSDQNVEHDHVKLLQPFKSAILLLYMLAAAIIFCSADIASAVEKPLQGQDVLMGTYQKYKVKLETNSFGLPLVVESLEQDERVHVDVYGIFNYPFNNVVSALKLPANWCDIVALHPNIKACTYRQLPGDWQLTFYPGSKEYQPPENTHPVMYTYQIVAQRQGYLDIALNAGSGPYGTKDHRMRFEAVPLDAGRTYVHISYTYSDSIALRLAAKIYFATIARSKVGFTVTGTERNGTPVYIGGPRGALERSAVRYYCAIQTFMNTLHYPEESRFTIRTGQWHDLTSRFRRQLFDLTKQDYLSTKIREHDNQMILQQRGGTGPH